MYEKHDKKQSNQDDYKLRKDASAVNQKLNQPTNQSNQRTPTQQVNKFNHAYNKDKSPNETDRVIGWKEL
jgi:hypothetical protein